MRNLIFTGDYFGERITIVQIQKRTAKRLFNAGETIFLQSCNMHPFGVWSQCIKINNKNGESFESVVNSFKYYNCNSESGLYAAFYTRVS